MSLSKTLYPLPCTGSNKEDRKTSRHNIKIVNCVVKHLHMGESFQNYSSIQDQNAEILQVIIAFLI